MELLNAITKRDSYQQFINIKKKTFYIAQVPVEGTIPESNRHPRSPLQKIPGSNFAKVDPFDIFVIHQTRPCAWDRWSVMWIPQSIIKVKPRKIVKHKANSIFFAPAVQPPLGETLR